MRVATDFELSGTAPLFKETVVTEILSVFGGAEEWNTFLLVDYSTWVVLACGVTTYEHSTWHYYITSNPSVVKTTPKYLHSQATLLHSETNIHV